MPYIVNSKFQEIREAARNGNDKAKMVMQAMRNMSSQDDVDRLMADYYDVEQAEVTMPVATVADSVSIDSEKPASIPDVEAVENPAPENVVDLTETLDGEFDGLFDDNELSDISFVDYINGKKKDALKARKNADYFKVYDGNGRAKYLNDKINAYKGKFDNQLQDITRRHNDIGISLDKYSQLANDMLDDDKGFDVGLVESAYNDFTGNDIVMHSFGRHWDNNDNAIIAQALKELIDHYGKNNIIAILNTLKNDNEEYTKHMNNRIDTEINRYSKNMESLLR